MYNIVRTLIAKSAIGRRLLPSYPYNFTPSQLAFLVQCVTDTRDVEGGIVEVGCATGLTTIYLSRHLSSEGINKPYTCVDTFEGFTRSDVAYERKERGKRRDDYTGFSVNSLAAFKATMMYRNVAVEAIKADIGVHEFAPHQRFAFCLLDVDLFKPTASGLSKLWPLMSSGGILVCDDVVDRNLFDGAYDAYHQFCRAQGITPEIRHGKLGVLRKSPQGK